MMMGAIHQTTIGVCYWFSGDFLMLIVWPINRVEDESDGHSRPYFATFQCADEFIHSWLK